jgi:WD40 repeat protein
MIHEHELETGDESRLEAMLAFDRALAFGDIPAAKVDDGPELEAVHECQRLLEAVWPRVVSPAALLPRQFGRYLILRELGRGAFGVVFLASDTVLGREVALKVPHPFALVTPEVRRRFLREAEAASRLDHPHIVPVYDVGEEGPICYIASAYCEGLTLAEWLRRQATSVPFLAAARLVAVLSAAVGHAHQRGILHRDLKPGNILLQRADPSASGIEEICSGLGYFPRICDFGLAKLLDQESHETCSGVPIGSPTYMAPEQAAGRAREHGPATDVYALGVILYELLTGKPPLRGETDLETLRLVLDQDPPAPRGLRRGLPRDLDTICLKCLEKRPKARYESATALADDLQRFLAGKSVHARPVRAWQHAGKWARRRPVHAALAAVTALAISVVLGVLQWSGAWLQKHKQDLSEAVAQAKRDVQLDERSAHGARMELSLAQVWERFAERFGLATQVKLLHDTFASSNVALAARMLESIRPSPGMPEPRGFAWGYVRQLFRPEVTLLGDPAPPPSSFSPVLQLTVAPDSRTLAAARADGRVDLWDLNENRLLRSHVNKEHRPGDEVYFSEFSRDGRFLAFANQNNVVRLWDLTTGGEPRIVPDAPGDPASPHQDVFAVKFTDHSDYLVIFRKGVKLGTFRVLFCSVPKPGGQPALVATLTQDQLPRYGAKEPLESRPGTQTGERDAPWLSYTRDHLVLLDDDSCLAIKEEGTGITFFDRTYQRTARTYGPLGIPILSNRATDVPNGAESTWWSARARFLAGSVHGPGRDFLGPYWCPDFSPDGRTLALYDAPVGAVLLDIASGQILLSYASEPSWRILDLAHTPDGRFLAIAGYHPQIHLWRLKPHVIPAHDNAVLSLAFSPDGKSLASAALDHTVKLWEVASAREHAKLPGHDSPVTAVAFSSDKKLLASASVDETIRLADAATGEHLATLRGHSGRVRTLTFSADARTLATAGEDLWIRLWDVANRREIAPPLAGHTGTVFSLVFSPDGETLFSGSTDKTIRLWDWRAGRARKVWQAENQVYSLALSPNGQSLAAAHRGGTVSLWDVQGQKRRALLKGHAGDVLGLTFSPDGLTLASTGNDRTVRIWDPATTQPLLTLQGHDAPVHAASFSPDGSILATGSDDGKIKLWRALREDQLNDKPKPGLSVVERQVNSNP